MTELKVDNGNVAQKEKLNFFDKLFEIVGWIQIVASPLLFSAIIGFLVYISNPNTTRLIIAIAIVAIGLLFGIIWANKIWQDVQLYLH